MIHDENKNTGRFPLSRVQQRLEGETTGEEKITAPQATQTPNFQFNKLGGPLEEGYQERNFKD